jgi:hypothetical protein
MWSEPRGDALAQQQMQEQEQQHQQEQRWSDFAELEAVVLAVNMCVETVERLRGFMPSLSRQLQQQLRRQDVVVVGAATTSVAAECGSQNSSGSPPFAAVALPVAPPSPAPQEGAMRDGSVADADSSQAVVAAAAALRRNYSSVSALASGDDGTSPGDSVPLRRDRIVRAARRRVRFDTSGGDESANRGGSMMGVVTPFPAAIAPRTVRDAAAAAAAAAGTKKRTASQR